MAASTIDDILRTAQQLTDEDFERLQAEIMSLAQARATTSGTIAAHDQTPATSEQRPRRSLLGLVADRGPAPSAEEIDEARREMWANFPRDDV